MRSKWYKLKSEAVRLRKNGVSIRKIESLLRIPRSTLSEWLKNINLTQKQKEKLLKNWRNGLITARRKAVLWHNAQKQERLEEAKARALVVLEKININDKSVLELALAILYLGEGAKKNEETSIGNSNPLILKFFLILLKNLYGLDNQKIKCQLNLRADQDPEKMKRFWSKELKLPLRNFGYVNLDKRTMGSKTYPHYKGVCQIHCGNVAIQRRLIYISEMFFKKVIDNKIDN